MRFLKHRALLMIETSVNLDSRENVPSDKVVIDDTDVTNDISISNDDVDQIEDTQDKSPLFVSRKIPKASVIASSDDTESDTEGKDFEEKIRTSKKVTKYAIKSSDDEKNSDKVIFSFLRTKLFEPEEKIETDKSCNKHVSSIELHEFSANKRVVETDQFQLCFHPVTASLLNRMVGAGGVGSLMV